MPDAPADNPPPLLPRLGKLALQPFRLQGVSVAGEYSIIQVPELGLCFDIGLCPREVLASRVVAISHGHVDHVAGLIAYLCQRQRAGLGPGRIVCHHALEPPVRQIMDACSQLEPEALPFKLVGLKHDQHLRLDEHHWLRGFETRHAAGSMGFVVYQRRKRLRKEYAHLSFEGLETLQARGESIMERHEVPLICYTGDTAWGPHFQRRDVQRAKILVTECSFLEAGHLEHARRGRHLHLDHIVSLLELVVAEAVVLTHLPRQMPMPRVRQMLDYAIPKRHHHRVFVLGA